MKKNLIITLVLFVTNNVFAQIEGTYSYSQEEDMYASGSVKISSLTDLMFDFSIYVESSGMYEKVKGTAMRDGNIGSYSDGNCSVTFVFSDKFVTISENDYCERENFGISGTYYNQEIIEIEKALDELLEDLEKYDGVYYSEHDSRSFIKTKFFDNKIEYHIHFLIEYPSYLDLKGEATLNNNIAISDDYTIKFIFNGNSLEFEYSDMPDFDGKYVKD